MFASPGAKGFISIVGNLIPGVIQSDPKTEDVVLQSGRVKKTQFAWVITLRQNLRGETYLALSYEDLGFFAPRGGLVDGLDVDNVTGSLLTAEDLGERIALNMAERQTAQASAAPAVVAADIG